MTARYRCPFCLSFTKDQPAPMRFHFYKDHAETIKRGLGYIETFTTREEAFAA